MVYSVMLSGVKSRAFPAVHTKNNAEMRAGLVEY